MAKEKASTAPVSSIQSNLDKITANIRKKFGTECINYLGNKKIEAIPKLKTQCSLIDAMLGGGYPVGRIIEFFGDESSGKSTVCYHAIAEAQKQWSDIPVGLIDVENSFDPMYVQKLGVNVGNLLVSQPDSGVEALNILVGMCEAGVKLIIVDSVAALLPKEEAAADGVEGGAMGAQARMMSMALRKINAVAGKHQTTIIFTNQIRSKIGVMYGDPTTTSGGAALKFYASVRMQFKKMKVAESGDEKTAQIVKVKTVKNKTYPPFKECTFFIKFGEGIDEEEAFLETLLNSGLIKKGGAWLSFEENKWCGRDALKTALKENVALKEKLQKAIENSNILNVEATEEEKADSVAEESPTEVENGEV